ncbi:hypothetical protein M0813_12883 [Anaeramoeba flamelloides]|uniref:Uncharacterized protein n=1 Tax=Anaeramoeba flamelloides TaxID=1746091 RepID=A0ABQ8ZAR7_9EUKA|nr:hypothetical protein M0813_12883 [Anaeramoeba flamelloides]
MSSVKKSLNESVQFQLNKSNPDTGNFFLTANRLQIRNKTRLLDIFFSPHHSVSHKIQPGRVALKLNSTSSLFLTFRSQIKSKEIFQTIQKHLKEKKRSFKQLKRYKLMDQFSKARKFKQSLLDQGKYQEIMEIKYQPDLQNCKIGLFKADYSFSGGDFIIDGKLKVTTKKLIFSQQKIQETVFVLRKNTKILDQNDSECIIQIFDGLYITIIFKHKIICERFTKILNKRLKYIKSVSSFQNSFIVEELSTSMESIKKYKLKILNNRISIRSKSSQVINIGYDNKIDLKYNSKFATRLLIQPKDYNARLFKFTNSGERDRFLEFYFFSFLNYSNKQKKKKQIRKKNRKLLKEKRGNTKRKMGKVNYKSENDSSGQGKKEEKNESKEGKKKNSSKSRKEKQINTKTKTNTFQIFISEIGKFNNNNELKDRKKAKLTIGDESIIIQLKDQVKISFKLEEIIIETSIKIVKIDFLDKKKVGNIYLQFQSEEEVNTFLNLFNHFSLK